MDLGLMANISEIQAIQGLGFVESINAAFNGETLANLAGRAGLPDKDVIRLKMQATREDIKTRVSQWQ